MDEYKKLFEQTAEKCLKDFPKLNEKTITQMFEKNFEGATEDIKCFILCVGMGLEEMDDKGVLKTDSVLSKVPPEFKKEKVAEILKACADKTGKDKCETAYEQTKCVSVKAMEAKTSLMANA